MRIMWQAVRAVTVEAIGVGAVIFVLFNAAGWSFATSSDQSKKRFEQAWQWVQKGTNDVTAVVSPNLSDDERTQFAAERLDYYSQLYRDAASTYAGDAAQLPRRADENRKLPSNQLLGTL